MHTSIIALGIVLIATMVYGEPSIMIAWEYPGDVPAPEQWRLTMVKSAQGMSGQEQMTLTVLDAQACQQWAGNTWAPETSCAAIPCSVPGAYQLILQAENGPPSNLAQFAILEGQGCRLGPIDQVPPEEPPLPRSEEPGVHDETVPRGIAELQEPEELNIEMPPEEPLFSPEIESPKTDPEDPRRLRRKVQRRLLKQLATMFTTLDQQYREQLERITAGYETVLTQGQGFPGEYQQAHAQAVRQQQEVYRQAQQNWQAFYAQYQRLIQEWKD